MAGADYSFARPGGAALAAAGITSVGRYIGEAGDGRCLTAAEYADLEAHGINVWLIRESTGREMLNGRAEGQNQARIAQAAIVRLGLPADSVVYFTADFAVQPSQYGVCDDYLRGVNDVFANTGRIGLYAGVPYLIHVKSWGGAAFWWKPGASSWSAGQSTDLHLEQLVGTAAGIAGTDANIIYADNHGQVGAQSISIVLEDDMGIVIREESSGEIGVLSPGFYRKFDTVNAASKYLMAQGKAADGWYGLAYDDFVAVVQEVSGQPREFWAQGRILRDPDLVSVLLTGFTTTAADGTPATATVRDALQKIIASSDGAPTDAQVDALADKVAAKFPAVDPTSIKTAVQEVMTGLTFKAV